MDQPKAPETIGTVDVAAFDAWVAKTADAIKTAGLVTYRFGQNQSETDADMRDLRQVICREALPLFIKAVPREPSDDYVHELPKREPTLTPEQAQAARLAKVAFGPDTDHDDGDGEDPDYGLVRDARDLEWALRLWPEEAETWIDGAPVPEDVGSTTAEHWQAARAARDAEIQAALRATGVGRDAHWADRIEQSKGGTL